MILRPPVEGRAGQGAASPHAMSMLKTLLPRMFHRRVLLLLTAMGIALSALGFQIVRVAAARGDSALAAAESKLIRRQMTPTVRGRILDRKGRILAQDKPSYDVAITYEVLAETWPTDRAGRFVRRAYREQWPDLTASQREELITRAAAVYRDHVSRGFLRVSQATGVPVDQLVAAGREALETVRRMHASVSDRRRRSDLDAFRARNRREPDAEELRTIERRAGAPIREMSQARVILPRVPDAAAFALRDLADEQIDLRPLGDDPGARADDRVELVPGLRVFDTGDRDYPLDSMEIEVDLTQLPTPIRGNGKERVFLEGVASHLIGWMREVWVDDEHARRDLLKNSPSEEARAVLDLPDGTTKDRGEYIEGDRVGQAGVEGAMEATLRGLRGMRTRSVDSGVTQEIPPEPGRDVQLSIDIMLQARVQAAMTPTVGLAKVQDWHRSATEPANPTMPAGTPINGAAVVVDVDTGEILAMVSTPPAPQRLRRDDPEAVFDDPLNLPYLNRAIDRPYPPGSIVKPLMFVEAVRRGSIRADEQIECTGHLLPNQPNMLQCWIWKRYKQTHSSQLEHDLAGADAIMVSCNIFFFTLGRRMGVDGITTAYRDFGVGRVWDLSIGPENGGFIGRPVGDPLELGDAIQMGIGQGPITWTPLHAACAYATLARGGVVVRPSIIRHDRRHARATTELDLPPAAVSVALEGLRRSVNEELGSGHAISYYRNGVRESEPTFNTRGVRVIGKTGTATAPDLKLARAESGEKIEEETPEGESDGVNASEARRVNKQGVEVVRSGDHSWFVVLAGREGESPRYAIAVVMEYAGSGGRVSGPICNQIVKALVAEGYLQPVDAPSPGASDDPPADENNSDEQENG
ncbi:MAG: hypothetical protein GIKADHBN_00825 [Phycisphaerales bacterium]|nr:hypothetical protein [Phycisphaerales bacterium]